MQQAQVVRQTKHTTNIRVNGGTLQLMCGCQREMVEDFDHDRMICLRCGNSVPLIDVIAIVEPAVKQASALLDIVKEAHEAYRPPEESEPERKPPRRRRASQKQEAEPEQEAESED
jgi:hypothetical protein